MFCILDVNNGYNSAILTKEGTSDMIYLIDGITPKYTLVTPLDEYDKLGLNLIDGANYGVLTKLCTYDILLAS